MKLLLNFYFILFILINYQFNIIKKKFIVHTFINFYYYSKIDYAKYINYLLINL